MKHQYIERETSRVRTEKLFSDPVVNLIYSGVRENAGFLFNLLISEKMSALLGAITYDIPFRRNPSETRAFLIAQGIDPGELAGRVADLDSYRKIFERQIRFWEVRPMPTEASALVSPADATVLVGSFSNGHPLFIKDKFFDYTDLVGPDKACWQQAFFHGDVAVFRLTPEKYHYNHAPVSGIVKDVYAIDGCFHSCNPGAVVREVTPLSKNRRVVTIINTDVPGGSRVGLVAMVEVVALMIGRIVQCYSKNRYDAPVPVRPGLFVEKGRPKSLFRPGSSTTLLIFQRGRMTFSRDIVENMARTDATSRFAEGFHSQLVETAVTVRSIIGNGLPLKNNTIKE
ncbi:MAG: phosphatidylserine decarboxylase [Desulfobacterium sp.]|nr:phosphatidylserine decarboxylase [Desulfobacterium sp.]